jgi:hypothetical protein
VESFECLLLVVEEVEVIDVDTGDEICLDIYGFDEGDLPGSADFGIPCAVFGGAIAIVVVIIVSVVVVVVRAGAAAANGETNTETNSEADDDHGNDCCEGEFLLKRPFLRFGL